MTHILTHEDLEEATALDALEFAYYWLKDNPARWAAYQLVNREGARCAVGACTPVTVAHPEEEEGIFQLPQVEFLNQAANELYPSTWFSANRYFRVSSHDTPVRIWEVNDRIGYQAVLRCYERAIELAREAKAQVQS